MSNAITYLRPLALSLALGLSTAGFASTAFAGQQTTWYDKWPEIQAQLQVSQPQQQEALATQAAGSAVTDGSGASLAPKGASSIAINGLGEHVDHTGIPVLQDRGMEN